MYQRPRIRCSSGAQTCARFQPFRGGVHTTAQLPTSTGDRDLMRVETSRGGEQTISTTKYEVTGRGGKGRELLQRGQFTRVIPPTPEAPTPFGLP